MIHTPTHRPAVRRADSQVPEELRGQVILLHFVEPVPRLVASWFYQVHPSRRLLRQAEDQFRLTERFQPQATGLQLCPNCAMPMRQLNTMEAQCTNRLCVLPGGQEGRAVRFVTGPKRGVIKVLVASDFVVGRDACGELIDRCALVLDRRYDEAARQLLYQAAGQVCDMVRQETGINLRLR